MPPAEQVREELERILSSDVFARSGRARDLLNYIVEQDLAGNAGRLKGFAIAVDVFGKSSDFDPANDTVVRVQMGRLRDCLTQYYARQGTGSALRIAIPRGSYVPVYSQPGDGAADGAEAGAEPALAGAGGRIDLPEGDAAVPGVPAGRTGRMPKGLAIAAAVAAVLLFGSTFYRSFAPQGGTPVEASASSVGSPVGFAETTGSVPHEALPMVYLDVEGGDASQRVAALLRRGLAGFDTVGLIARAPTPDVQGAHLRTDFVFEVHPQGGGNVLVEVHNVVSGKVLVSRVLDGGRTDGQMLEDQVADTLSSVVSVSGVIYAWMAEAGAQTTLVRCLMLNERFYREQRADAHRAAYECLEELAAAGSKSPMVYSELASLHIQALHNRYDYPAGASAEGALELARLAVQYGPNSPSAHRSMGYVLSRTASAEESLRWTQKAYELNTFDLGMAASYGYALVFAGDYAGGTPILQRAVNATSAHPTWWDYGLFLGHFMNGADAEAADAVSALGASTRSHYVAARLIAAHATGHKDAALSLVNQLSAEHDTFASDPLAFYQRAKYPPDMIDRLVAALREAGLGSAS